MYKSILLLCFWLIFVSPPSVADELDYRVKSAFIFKFCSYIQWPQSSFAKDTSPFVVGATVTARQMKALRSILEGKKALGRPFQVRAVEREADLEGLHIFYVGLRSKKFLLRSDFMKRNPPVLTITDYGYRPKNSIINFIVLEEYLRFEISKSRADQVGLKISSQLLEIAEHVD